MQYTNIYIYIYIYKFYASITSSIISILYSIVNHHKFIYLQKKVLLSDKENDNYLNKFLNIYNKETEILNGPTAYLRLIFGFIKIIFKN